MDTGSKDIWTPTARHISEANATTIGRNLGLPNYDALYQFSIEKPEAYWAEISRFCGIRWSKNYEVFCDLSQGREFPSWFVGGELNWVDTILACADDAASAGKQAVVAEREDGSASALSYRELRDEVRAMAAGLAGRGVRRGDRIGLLMENGVEATVSVLALSYLGAIVVPLFSGFGSDAIVSRLSACSARGLIATTGFLRRGRFVDVASVVEESRRHLPGLELVVLKRSPNDPDQSRAKHGSLDWDEIRAAPETAAPSVRMSPNDPFMVIFTSGTTGKPKGAVHVHGGFPLKIAHDATVLFDVKPDDVVCWPADMGWIAGALVLASALMRGATLVCYDGAPDFPDWSRMSRLVETYKATIYGSSPTMVRGFAANEAVACAGDTSSIRLLITSGETIAPEHFIWLQRHFGRGECPLINYTGGTEVSGGLLSNVVVKPITPAGFNTRAPGIAVEVIDPAGKPVVGQVGELAILAPFIGMTRGFWQNRERYLETYWQAVPGIWVHGDLALKDDSGTFFLLGRSDDTLKIAGKRVGPAEIEEIVVEIEGVSEAAAIGADDQVKGQAIIVFATAPGAADPGALVGAITGRVRDRLGKPFAPREVFIVPQLPKTRSSKIMRRLIRSIYAQTPPGDVSALANPESIGQIESIVRDR